MRWSAARSSASRICASCAAAASTSTTCRARRCCTPRSCAARSRTAASVAIDTAAALRAPGVHAVITAADIGSATFRSSPCGRSCCRSSSRYQQPVIAHDKVRYVGEPIAVVVADSAALAEDALEAIALDIEALPAVADRDAARATKALLFEATGTQPRHHADRGARATPTPRSGTRPTPAASASRCSASPR